MKFSKDEVLRLAEAILECPVHSTGSDVNPLGYYCEHCDNEHIDGEPQRNGFHFQHKPDCPVLLAQDIMRR